MTNRESEIVNEEPVFPNDRDTAELTTADMAAAGAAPTRAREAADTDSQLSGRAETESLEQGVEPLFDEGEAEGLRARWYSIQTGFVDEPRKSVEEADQLVATVMKRLAEVFSAERQNLERDWDRGDDVSTEDLRIALRRYRSFFDRLLSV